MSIIAIKALNELISKYFKAKPNSCWCCNISVTMISMTAQDIRRLYLEFFEKRGHVVIARAQLMPLNDPTTLFIGSGMQPLVPYLLGEPHPSGKRLVDSQTCLRAQDIEEVGDNRHTTFFEMLGNWSLGDYFKEEQIPWFWQFMTEIVGLDPNKLYVTCFAGDEKYGIPRDNDSSKIWKDLFATKGVIAETAEVGSEAAGYERGMKPGERIFYYDADKNWWCGAGKIGDMPIGSPGGPDTEMFYEFDFIEHDPKFGKHCHPNCDCGRFMEIGNSVFMEFVRTEHGFDRLPSRNVDFGGGLERIAAAKLNSPDVFQISLIKPIIEHLEQLSGASYQSHTESMRVIADHLRAATFLAVDGVKPSNKEQGYVMRRLLRRAIRYAFGLGVERNFLQEVVPVIADLYEADFPEIKTNRQGIIDTLTKEEKAFRQTLRKGLKEFEKIVTQNTAAEARVQGDSLFHLYDTFGFPVELSVEEAFKRGISLSETWRQEFESKMAEQRTRSQTAAKGTFKGGLGGQTMQHKKYHTATHLMYKALQIVLGDHVMQHGSNITEERLRFDFNHPEKMTADQIHQVEDIVNQQIDNDLQVSWEEHPTEYALNEMHVKGAFGDRYGAVVKCYRMQASDSSEPFSLEICGGPHVEHTAQLGEGGKRFAIVKEESSSAGIRRIKAVLR